MILYLVVQLLLTNFQCFETFSFFLSRVPFFWITNKDLLSSIGSSAQCYAADWMGGELRGEWNHVYVWLSPFAVYLKLSQHC